jgi:hypothetical protein
MNWQFSSLFISHFSLVAHEMAVTYEVICGYFMCQATASDGGF